MENRHCRARLDTALPIGRTQRIPKRSLGQAGSGSPLRDQQKNALLLFPLVFLLACSLSAFAQGSPAGTPSSGAPPVIARSVSAQGDATIANNDEAAARNAALADAMRKAVEQAVGEIVPSQTALEDYKVLNDTIYSNTSRYVSDYTVLGEAANNNIYTVEIKATISTAHLKEALNTIGLLAEQKKMPRVAVIILEHDCGGKLFSSSLLYAPTIPNNEGTPGQIQVRRAAGPPSMAEREIAGQLADNGFNVIKHADILSALRSARGYTVQTLNDSTVQTIGRLSNIAVIFYGTADARLDGEVPGSEMRFVLATVSLRAIDTVDGRLLFSGEQHAVSIHTDLATAGKEALKKAVDRVADKMIAPVLDAWKQQTGSGTPIRLTVDDVSSPAVLGRLMGQIMTLSGVQHVYQRSIGGGATAMDVNFKGDARELTAALIGDRAITTLSAITVTTTNTIRARIK